MSKILTKADIVAADDLPTEDVPVPEWGGAVRVRALTGTERSQYQAALVSMSADGKQRSIVLENADVRLAALSIVDEDGNRLFDLKDVEALGRKSARALNRIVEVAQRLSALNQRDIEELTEGFDEAPSDDSTSS